MSTEVTQRAAPAVPAHITHLANLPFFSEFEDKVVGGISEGGHPRLSIRGSKFRLVSAEGEEVNIPSLNVEVVIIGANENVSKAYYLKAYDPNSEDVAMPDCFSDNGFGPSTRCTSPQAKECSTCPNNAFGSKITPTGSAVKACGDSKRLAVLPIGYLDGKTGTRVEFDISKSPVYELRVPASSMKNVRDLVNKAKKNGVPLAAAVVRLGFDEAAEYPKVTFVPTRYITEAEAKVVMSFTAKVDEIDMATGRNDKARDPAVALPAPAQQSAPAPVVQAGQQQTARPEATVAVMPPVAKTEEMPPIPGFMQRSPNEAVPSAPSSAPSQAAAAPVAAKPRGKRAQQQPETQPGIVVEPEQGGKEYDALLADLGLELH